MTIFTQLLIKAVESAAQDSRISTYKEPKLATPEYGAAHRSLGKRVYKTYALIHVLDFLNFADSVANYCDDGSWSKEERSQHLQKVVGTHRRRIK